MVLVGLWRRAWKGLESDWGREFEGHAKSLEEMLGGVWSGIEMGQEDQCIRCMRIHSHDEVNAAG